MQIEAMYYYTLQGTQSKIRSDIKQEVQGVIETAD